MATASKNLNMKHRSREVTEGPHRAPARSYMWAMGLSQEDMDRPFVAIANLASDITPCNVHLDRFAQGAKEGVRQGEGTPFEFGTITVSDGISMGTEGMKASLVSREVIADSIEVVAFAERMDGLIAIAGCDKNMPGCMMAMARLNIPSIFIYGGTIMPGRFQGRDVNVQDVFEAVGAYAKNNMSLEDLRDLERRACPGEGSCAGLFTANTMSTAIEALGMSLPGDASIPAPDPRKLELSRQAGQTLMRLLAEDVRPRDILTRQAFENAITVAVAMGGSTNVVLHLLAIANEAGVALSLGDFDRISRNTPYIADMKPGGRYVMADLDRYGGVSLVIKRLLEAGLLHGDAMTVTGKSVEGQRCRDCHRGRPAGGLHRGRSAEPHRRPGHSLRQSGPRRGGDQGGRDTRSGSTRARRGSSSRKNPPSRPSSARKSSPETLWSSATKGPRADRGCGRCWR